ncbi:MAG: LPS export ABC transporter ATP-binding protein [Hydrotalea sp.]|nr:LPS export ABC transporter ATP-binding protein [Hydrotalea sp.]
MTATDPTDNSPPNSPDGAAASNANAASTDNGAGQSPDRAPASVLRVEHVKKIIGKRTVVNDASLTLRAGEVVGLLGPNGAGKTTLFYGILGLIPINGGHIFIDDTDISTLPVYRRARRGLSYLPQEASIFRGLTVRDNLRAVLEMKMKNREDVEAYSDQLLKDFNLTERRDAQAVTLSGGERRRLEIARALCAFPAFLLLDEPFAGVDPLAIRDVRQLVKNLAKRGIGVLITDHNVRETLRIVERAYIIHDGKIIAAGTPQDIINNPLARELYLGEEVTQELQQAGTPKN